MITKNIKLVLIVILVSCFKIEAKNPIQPKWLNNALNRAESQLLLASNEFKNTNKTPRTFENGKVELVTINDWTCGFFSGSLWYMYEITGNDQLKTEAERYTQFLEGVQHRKNTHDLGFMINCSYGNGFRLTGNKKYKELMITGANSLMTRYHANVGLIKSWDNRRHWEYPVIIDNMLNLEFLCDMGRMTGDKNMIKASVSHADKTIENHFRPDNSCFHVVNYDSISGKVISKETHQGFSDSSSWARGQGWALYGYTMMYRETKDVRFLEQAEKIAKFIFTHPNLPKDKIPYWDFDAPNIPYEPRDASAAAIYASALIELSGFVKENNNYFTTAEKILKNLSSDKYLAKKGENGLFVLMHSTGNWPKNSEIDTPLSYADYYYIEALVRYMKVLNK